MIARNLLKRLRSSARHAGVASQRLRRPILLSRIVARRKRTVLAVASPLDFSLADERELAATRGKWPAPAYCLNKAEQRVLFAVCPDNQCLFEAPFFWQAQHQHATHIASVPFERLNEFVDVVPRNPIFIFSIGRCGSTLLSALLRASGARSVSEPDVLTQLALPAPNGPRKMAPALRRLLIEACVASLVPRPTMPVALKLRSQCNTIAREIAHAFPDGTYVVLMRDRHAWLRSQLRALGGDPRVLASSYRRGLQTFHDLQADGANSLMMWYEDLVGDPETAIRQLHGDLPPGSAGIANIPSIMKVDAQAGTVLQRNKAARKGLTAEQVRIFDEEWERIRPDSWIESYGLDRLRPS